MSIIKSPRIKKIAGTGLLSLAATILVVTAANAQNSNSNAAKTIKLDNSLVLSPSDTAPAGTFLQGEEKELERTLPYIYLESFIDFKISFQPQSRQTYKKGESLGLKGKVSYAPRINPEAQKEIEGCLKNLEGKSDKEKSQTCSTSSLHKFVSFPNAGILAQIWREDPDKEARSKKGDYLADEFYIMEKTALEENKEKEFAINWKIPENTPSGNYYVSLFLNQNKTFSLKGFSVNVFAPAVRFDFNVAGEKPEQGLLIDKNNIRINETDYSQILPIPTVKPVDGKINFEIPVINPDSQEKELNIKYELFRLTQENPSNIVLSREEKKTIAPRSTAKLDFAIPAEKAESFSTLKVTLNSNNKSVIDIHFAAEGKHLGIIRLLELAKSEKDNNFYPVFCLRDAQWLGSLGGKIKISLSGERKQSADTWEREGTIEAKDNQCFALKSENMKLKKTNCAKIKGEVFDKSGKTTDSQEVSYGCDTPNLQPASGSEKSSYDEIFDAGKILFFLFTVLFIIIVGVLVYLLKKKTNETKK